MSEHTTHRRRAARMERTLTRQERKAVRRHAQQVADREAQQQRQDYWLSGGATA